MQYTSFIWFRGIAYPVKNLSIYNKKKYLLKNLDILKLQIDWMNCVVNSMNVKLEIWNRFILNLYEEFGETANVST